MLEFDMPTHVFIQNVNEALLKMEAKFKLNEHGEIINANT
jgi:hypothetical protein